MSVRLVADVGGTNVRFARAAANGQLSCESSHPVAAFSSFAAVLDHYLATTGGAAGITSCAIGVAGPADGDTIALTNYPWTVSASDCSRRMPHSRIAVINDVEAVAVALPHLRPADVMSLGTVDGATDPRTLLAVNVGTGFGSAVALQRGSRWWTLSTEAGHMTLTGGKSDRVDATRLPSSVEEALSGEGVVSAYDGRLGRQSHIGAAEIFQRVRADPIAAEVANGMTQLMGDIVGDLVLATGAWDGAYLCGSVAAGWASIANHATFRSAFENKGKMQQRLRQVPTAVITRDHVALLGLAMLSIDRPLQ